jgi:hypothetical protein
MALSNYMSWTKVATQTAAREPAWCPMPGHSPHLEQFHEKYAAVFRPASRKNKGLESSAIRRKAEML